MRHKLDKKKNTKQDILVKLQVKVKWKNNNFNSNLNNNNLIKITPFILRRHENKKLNKATV